MSQINRFFQTLFVFYILSCNNVFTTFSASFSDLTNKNYNNSFLIIPDSIDIENSQDFFVSAFDSDGNSVSEVVLFEDAIENDDRILLKDNVNMNVLDGFKVIEVRIPVYKNGETDNNGNDDFFETKISSGYKINGALGSEYVFLANDSLDETSALNLITTNPFDILDPSSHTFDVFPGVLLDGEKLFSMIPIRDVSKNFSLEFYTSSTSFDIDNDGFIVPSFDYTYTIDILGVGVLNLLPIFSNVRGEVKIIGDTSNPNFSQEIEGLNSLNIQRLLGNLLNPTPTSVTPDPTVFNAGSKIQVGARDKSSNPWRWTGTGNNSSNEYAKVYSAGDSFSNAGLLNDLSEIIGIYLNQNIVDIPENSALIVFDFNGNANVLLGDLQYAMFLITLYPDDPLTKVTVLQESGSFISESIKMTSKGESSSRSRKSDIIFNIQNEDSSSIKFDVRSIGE